MNNNKCIVILSERSSGSSALQNFLIKFTKAQHVEKTKHYEFETLFWTKAASILGKPQINMLDSRVPFGYKQAKADILTLLKENLIEFEVPNTDFELIKNGWKALCNHYSPIFVEKSPHHLCEWSALELMVDCFEQLNDIDYLIIGLVRNPLATIYSQYRRWFSIPKKIEKQWVLAYQNLLRLKEIAGNNLLIVRYEDLIYTKQTLKPILEFCDVDVQNVKEDYFHSKSLQKWKNDPNFGFSLSHESIELAKRFGYQTKDLTNKSYFFAPIIHHFLHTFYQLKVKFRNFYYSILDNFCDH